MAVSGRQHEGGELLALALVGVDVRGAKIEEGGGALAEGLVQPGLQIEMIWVQHKEGAENLLYTQIIQ